MTKTSAFNALAFKDAICDALDNGADIAGIPWQIPQTGRMDWLGFESAQRVIFQLTAGGTLSDRQALILLAETLGAFTGRGAGTL